MIFVYIFIIGVPGLLVLFTTRKMIMTRKIKQEGIKTMAVVSSIKLVKINKSFFDKIQLWYRDHTGGDHTAQLTAMSGKYKRSDEFQLWYLRDNPAAYAIAGMQQGQWTALVFFILLLAFMIFASFKLDEMVHTAQ